VSTFDVPVKLPITMRDDCQLVIVEAPGLNISSKDNGDSRAYFRDNWDSFDACFLVMGPGGYRVPDFLRAGSVMTLLFLLVMLLMMNLVF